ncbi:unnamed protein product [Dicrocoelium dendriticum]|nr:unnamed protein product [Dicrocoelium dendriticum]
MTLSLLDGQVPQWILLSLQVLSIQGDPSTNFTKWLDMIPKSGLPPVSPILNPEERRHFKPIPRSWPRYKFQRTFDCYTCQNCIAEPKTVLRTESDCTECVVIHTRPNPPYRMCNRGNTSICLSNTSARCCRSNLCNHATKSRGLHYLNYTVLTIWTVYQFVVFLSN